MSPMTIPKVTHIWKGGKVTESLGRDLKMLAFLDLFPPRCAMEDGHQSDV